jgi:hypothetical protein
MVIDWRMSEDDSDNREIVQVLQERYDGWTMERQVAFVEALGANPNVAAACRAVGLGTTSAYRLKARSPSFARAWDAALQRNRLDLERTAMEWAVDGIEEPVFNRSTGEQTGTRRRRSAGVTMFMLRAMDPEKYGRATARPASNARGGGWRETKRADGVLTDMPAHPVYWKKLKEGSYTNPYNLHWDGTFAGAERLLRETRHHEQVISAVTDLLSRALWALGWRSSVICLVELINRLSAGEDVFDELLKWGLDPPISEASRRKLLAAQAAHQALMRDGGGPGPEEPPEAWRRDREAYDE